MVHYAGNSCDLDALSAVLGEIPLVEDAAQALGASFRGRALGTFGKLAAFSFHETKNVGCGEGGALTVNAPELVDRAEFIREKGTNRRRFSQGLVDKYTWVDVGSSYVLSELNSAYLEPQLDAFALIQSRRKEIHRSYEVELAPDAARAGVRLLATPEHNSGNAHLFAMVFRSFEQRSRFIAHMKAAEILTPFHYVALHTSPMGARFHDGRPLPNSEALSQCLVRLPLFFNMEQREVEQVIARTREFLRGL